MRYSTFTSTEMQRANICDNTDGDDTSVYSITEGELGRLLDDYTFDAPGSPPSTTHDEAHLHHLNVSRQHDSASFSINLDSDSGGVMHAHDSWTLTSAGAFSSQASGNTGDSMRIEGHNVVSNTAFERAIPCLNEMEYNIAGNSIPSIQAPIYENISVFSQNVTDCYQLPCQGQVLAKSDLVMPDDVPQYGISVHHQNRLNHSATPTTLPHSNMDFINSESAKLNTLAKPARGSAATRASTKSVKTNASAYTALTRVSSNAIKDSLNVVVSKPLLSCSSIPTPATFQELSNEVAYERKKSRAKNARMMINESIDKISVAISAAGVQSKERHDQLLQMEQENQRRLAAQGVSQKIATGHNHDLSHSKRVLIDCVSIAKSAKKWDRPRFLESSATMMQAMNSQCEALMRELVSCHDQINKMNKYMQHLQKNSMTQFIDNPIVVTKQTGVSVLQTDTQQRPNKNVSKNDSLELLYKVNPPKKVKVDYSLDVKTNKPCNVTADEIVAAVLAERKVMNRIMQYLDTATKAKCLLRVSKSWKRGDCFDIDQLWCDMCSTRLSSSNVRIATYTNDTIKNEPCISASETLFWRMYTAKVMPRFFKASNMVYLGEGHIPGKALGWTFLVEPGNGETTRSVRSPPTGSQLFNDHRLGGSDDSTFLPVIKLWTIVQNIAIAHDEPIVIRDQIVTVDASTRRRSDEMKEIYWDVSYKKRLLNLHGTAKESNKELSGMFVSSDTFTSCAKCGNKELCHLKLFDAVIIETNIYAKGCPTTSKFLQKSNYLQLLIQVPTMTTMPLVIRFDKDASSVAKQTFDTIESMASSLTTGETETEEERLRDYSIE